MLVKFQTKQQKKYKIDLFFKRFSVGYFIGPKYKKKCCYNFIRLKIRVGNISFHPISRIIAFFKNNFFFLFRSDLTFIYRLVRLESLCAILLFVVYLAQGSILGPVLFIFSSLSSSQLEPQNK